MAAYALSGHFPLGFVARVEPHPGARFEPVVHLLGPVAFVVALLLWVLTSLLIGEGRLRIRERPRLVDSFASRISPAPAATAVRFAFSRRAREPGSARVPLVALVVVLGGLVAALTFGASLDRLIDDPGRYGSGNLTIGSGGGEIPAEVRAALESDPDVDALALAGTVLTSVGTTALDVTGLQPVLGNLAPRLLSGRLPTGEDEIALGRVTAHNLGVKVGEDLELVGASGPRTLHVSGLAVIPPVEGNDGVGLGGLVTSGAMRRIDPAAELTNASFRLRPGAPTGTVARIAEATGMAVGSFETPAAIVNVDRVRSIPFVVAATLGALTVLSLAHQLIISAQHHRRDLAILRALGADRRWVTSVVQYKASIFTFVVLALAAPFGIAGGRFVYRAFVDRIGAENGATMPLWMFGVTLLMLMALANLVAAVPARRARRLQPARYLAQE